MSLNIIINELCFALNPKEELQACCKTILVLGMFFGNILPALSNNVVYFESMSRCCIFSWTFPELKWTVFATLPLHMCVAFEACASLTHCGPGGVGKEWFSVCYTYVKFTHPYQNVRKLFHMKIVLHHLSSFLWPTETLPTETVFFLFTLVGISFNSETFPILS